MESGSASKTSYIVTSKYTNVLTSDLFSLVSRSLDVCVQCHVQ